VVGKGVHGVAVVVPEQGERQQEDDLIVCAQHVVPVDVAVVVMVAVLAWSTFTCTNSAS
jgi:3,4-dihydroxy-2-butanone 4-phosphate synthase